LIVIDKNLFDLQLKFILPDSDFIFQRDADEDVDVLLESLCFSCPPTIVDEQCKVNVIMDVLI
jgi:hypothetical protein